jgi:hypothetical protein
LIYLILGGNSVSNLKAMFEKKPAADPFPKKPLGGGVNRGTTLAATQSQPEPPKVEAPQAQSVSNLKSVFGFERS